MNSGSSHSRVRICINFPLPLVWYLFVAGCCLVCTSYYVTCTYGMRVVMFGIFSCVLLPGWSLIFMGVTGVSVFSVGGSYFLSFSYMMAIILFMVPSSTVSFLDITLFLSGPSSCICTRWLWGSWYFFGVTGINILYICWRDAFSIASNAARSDSETGLITSWIFCLLCYARIGCFGNVDIFRE